MILKEKKMYKNSSKFIFIILLQRLLLTIKADSFSTEGNIVFDHCPHTKNNENGNSRITDCKFIFTGNSSAFNSYNGHKHDNDTIRENLCYEAEYAKTRGEFFEFRHHELRAKSNTLYVHDFKPWNTTDRINYSVIAGCRKYKMCETLKNGSLVVFDKLIHENYNFTTNYCLITCLLKYKQLNSPKTRSGSICLIVVFNDKPLGDIINKVTGFYIQCALASEKIKPHMLPNNTCNSYNCKLKFQTTELSSVTQNDTLLAQKNYDIDVVLVIHHSKCGAQDPDSYGTYYNAGSYTKSLIYIGKAGVGLSTLALVAHLVIFCKLPTLRNLPGYSLACYSLSLLLAYVFVLVGQIPQEVKSTSCVVSAILLHTFFMSAFFWLNAMAFDVWHSLKLATGKFVVRSNTVKSLRFLYYSLYAWGCPAAITSIAVVFDNIDSAPYGLKPTYGRFYTCWMGNVAAERVFFRYPAIALFVTNSLLYFLIARMLFSQAPPVCSSELDEARQVVKRSFFFHLKLVTLTGMTWLLGIISAYATWRPIFYIFYTLNSLQGVFVFLLFSCSKKVWRLLLQK